MLNEGNIATLLKNVYQVNEFQMALSYEKLNDIPLQWFPLIWGYINKYGILRDFERLPLIPLGTSASIKTIAVLQRHSLLIHCKDNDEDDAISLLKHLGFTVIKELPAYILQNSTVFNDKYIHQNGDGNLLTMLSILRSQFGEMEIVKRFNAFGSKKAKLDLLCKISPSVVPEEICSLLRSLEFIENTKNEHLVSIKDCNLIAPKELPSVMPQEMLLKILGETQRSFISKLGGKILNKRDFIETILLPEIENKSVSGTEADSMIKYILDTIRSDDPKQCQGVIERLSNIKFREIG